MRKKIKHEHISFVEEYSSLHNDTLAACKKIEEKLLNFMVNEKLFPEKLFGLELRVAYLLAEKQITFNPSLELPSIPSSGLKNYRKFLLRPAHEPILWSYKDVLLQTIHNNGQLEELASCLFGRKVTYRQSDAKTKPDRKNIVRIFPKSTNVLALLNKRACRQQSKYKLFWAISRFVDFNIIHPFLNGNGRTARALLLHDLSIIFNNNWLLFLPLGPVHTGYSDYGIEAFSKLQRINDANDLFILICKEIEAACELLQKNN